MALRRLAAQAAAASPAAMAALRGSIAPPPPPPPVGERAGENDGLGRDGERLVAGAGAELEIGSAGLAAVSATVSFEVPGTARACSAAAWSRSCASSWRM